MLVAKIKMRRIYDEKAGHLVICFLLGAGICVGQDLVASLLFINMEEPCIDPSIMVAILTVHWGSLGVSTSEMPCKAHLLVIREPSLRSSEINRRPEHWK